MKGKIFFHVNEKGENALILATKCICRNCVQLLLENGINDVNHQDYRGNTALHYAVGVKDRKIVDMLLANGADVSIKNNEGLDTIQFAKKLRQDLVNKVMEYSYLIAKLDEIIKILSNEKSNIYDKISYISSGYSSFNREDLIQIYREVKPYLNPDFEKTFCLINCFTYFESMLKPFKKSFGSIENKYYSYPYCHGNILIFDNYIREDICTILDIDLLNLLGKYIIDH
eukprot:jgi/Orpsp1_1/1174821/evm.model.c7180000051561.2